MSQTYISTFTAEVLAEEADYRKKAQEIRDKKREIEENKNTTLEDLTRGLLNYRYTGLNFEKGQNGGLMCVTYFTNSIFSLIRMK